MKLVACMLLLLLILPESGCVPRRQRRTRRRGSPHGNHSPPKHPPIGYMYPSYMELFHQQQYQTDDFYYKKSLHSCMSMDYYACHPKYPYIDKHVDCIPFEDVCDGFADCPLMDDEKYCDRVRPTPVIVTETVTRTSTTTSTRTEQLETTTTTTLSPDVTFTSSAEATLTASFTDYVITTFDLPAGDLVSPGEPICETLVIESTVLSSRFKCITSATVVTVDVSTELVCTESVLYP